jgi:hypothetical protein
LGQKLLESFTGTQKGSPQVDIEDPVILFDADDMGGALRLDTSIVDQNVNRLGAGATLGTEVVNLLTIGEISSEALAV